MKPITLCIAQNSGGKALENLILHPYISACNVDKRLSKMAGNSASYALCRE